jgi:hypothetical protein
VTLQGELDLGTETGVINDEVSYDSSRCVVELYVMVGDSTWNFENVRDIPDKCDLVGLVTSPYTPLFCYQCKVTHMDLVAKCICQSLRMSLFCHRSVHVSYMSPCHTVPCEDLVDGLG